MDRPMSFHDWLEEHERRVEELADPSTLVCRGCIFDVHLWSGAEQRAEHGVCDFCGSEASCVRFEAMEEVITDVLGQYYVSVSESGAYHDEGDWTEEVHDVRDITEEMLFGAVKETVETPLVQFVCERNAVDYGFVRVRDLWGSLYDYDEGAWNTFMRDTRTRGHMVAASDLVAKLEDRTRDLFRKIEMTARLQGRYKFAQPNLWRFRQGPADPGFRTAPEIGTAPDGLAAAGRMTVQGHSAFYASTTQRGAVIEIAKHCGTDSTLWGGRFTPSRPIYHVDLMELPEEPSVFAPDAAADRDAISFLRRFAMAISQPNDPSDTQHYLPTQLFVAYLIAGPEPLRPDAIRYRSSLDPNSENWVVFVSNAQCIDEPAPDSSDLYLVLDKDTVDVVTERDLLQREH